MNEIEILSRGLEAKNRIINRHIRFRLDAAKHIPALIAGNQSSPEWQAAIEWWEQCNTDIVRST